jgi:hypothetical protein
MTAGESVARRLQAVIKPGSSKRAAVWFVLVAVSVLGRLWQPAWNVTPLMGAAIASGVAFSHPFAATSVPLAALTVSNLALPGYGIHDWKGVAMVAVIAVALSWPVLLGGLVRRHRATAAICGALAGSLVFYLSTNFAHWLLTDDYPHTVEGLLACYGAALPFFRWMPVGDVAWTLAFVGGLFACRGTADSAERIPHETTVAA